MQNTKLFTIVTVCRNAEKVIESTIKSVLSQKDATFEYIIIDGLSSDSTLTIIEGFSKNIDKVISERDSGIYDAMNKGIRQASGEFILFMNAGDVFIDDSVLNQIEKQLQDADIFYGDVRIDYGAGIQFDLKAKPISRLYRGMICSHQSLVTARKLLISNPFNPAFKIAADYQQLLNCMRMTTRIVKSNLVVSKITAGGVSDLNQMATYREYIRAVHNVNPEQKIPLLLLKVDYIKIAARTVIKKLLPVAFHVHFRRLKSSFSKL